MCEQLPLAASYLRRFGSVTVLNGHIQQILQVEGSVHFDAAASTAFPQPAPGAGARLGTIDGSSRSIKKPARNHKSELRPEKHELAVVDSPLAPVDKGSNVPEVKISNSTFNAPGLESQHPQSYMDQPRRPAAYGDSTQKGLASPR